MNEALEKKRKEEVVHSIETWQEAVRSNKLCNQRSREPSLQQQKRKNEEREREVGADKSTYSISLSFPSFFIEAFMPSKNVTEKEKSGLTFAESSTFLKKSKAFGMN